MRIEDLSIEDLKSLLALAEKKSQIKKVKKDVKSVVKHNYQCGCCQYEWAEYYEIVGTSDEIKFTTRTCDKCVSRLAKEFDNVEEALEYMLYYIKTQDRR